MKTIKTSILTAIFLFSTVFLYSQGYEIQIKVNHLKDTNLIIGHYLNKSMYPDDTIKLDANGQGVFRGEKAMPGGLYVIYLPSTLYFEVILAGDQHFTIQTDTSDFVNTLVFEGSEENEVFLQFQKYMIDLRQRANMLSARLQAEASPEGKEEITAQLQAINQERISAIESLAAENEGLFVADFLKATLEIQVPEPPANADQNWQYYYFRNHYFDNFDLSDPRLLRTPLYEDKMINYLTQVIPQIPDTIMVEADRIIEKSRSDSTLFRYVLVTLFNHFGRSNIMGMDAVQIHLAEKYYLPESWWSDADFITDLEERVEKTKPLLIGKTAPDVELMTVPSDHFMQAAQDTALKSYPHVGTNIRLHDIEAEYLVLVFWEADCGHCQTAIPLLYDMYESTLENEGVKILAISTLFGEEGKVKWTDFVNEHHLYDWMNAWNPYSYDYKLQYDILSTPTIFILDRNKKIIAKKISPEQVADIIDSLLNT